MEQQIFEGTWEEILQHTSELVGRRVKLTVFAEQTPNSTVTMLDQLLKGRVGRVNFQPSNLSERTGEAFADLLASKYSPKGLNP